VATKSRLNEKARKSGRVRNPGPSAQKGPATPITKGTTRGLQPLGRAPIPGKGQSQMAKANKLER
jgi:hypothetical protein